MEGLDADAFKPGTGAAVIGQISSAGPVDCVYVAASSHDSRFTRICVASIRHSCGDIPIRLLCGGPIHTAFIRELRNLWGVEVAPFPEGNYGWGFVKLEPLFGLPGERFLILDSDTVITGPIFKHLDLREGSFVVDDEQQSEQDTIRLYYDWQRVREKDPAAGAPAFVFNSGQWIGTAGVLHREDFSPWIDWQFPRKLHHPELFMPGDQGVLNYVMNQKAALTDLYVSRMPLMLWPGHGMPGVTSQTIIDRSARPCIVHWAGVKTLMQRQMVGADILAMFEKKYYERMPAGTINRFIRGIDDVSRQWIHQTATKLKMKLGQRRS